MNVSAYVPLAGQVTIVTGAGRGIGRAISTRLAERGAVVALADIVPERIQSVAEEMTAAGHRVLAVAVDTGSRASIDAMMARVTEHFGRLDILVNNAGIARSGSFLETTAESWDDHMRINLGGVFHCSQAAARIMMANRSGRIVSVASVAGLMGPIDLSAYGASKAGVIGLTRSMALELAEYGITVNAIAPGPIDTELLREGWSEAAYAERPLHIPSRRIGRVEEIAHAVEMLVLPDAGFISGVTVPVDGGSVAAGAYMVERYRRIKAGQ